MKKLFNFLFVVSLVFVFVLESYGQFKPDQRTLGVSLGFGGGGLTGTGGIPISAEFNFLEIDKNIQGGVFASFASTSEDWGSYEWTYTNIAVAAQASYHFSLDNKKIDPYIGLSLGYLIVSSSSDAPDGVSYDAAASTIFWSGQLGVNYWFNKNMAVHLRLGYFPYASLGVNFVI